MPDPQSREVALIVMSVASWWHPTKRSSANVDESLPWCRHEGDAHSSGTPGSHKQACLSSASTHRLLLPLWGL